MKEKLEQSIFAQKAKWQAVAEHLCTALPEDAADAWAEGYLRGYLYQEGFAVRWKHPAGCACAVSAAFGGEGFCLGILAPYEDAGGQREGCVAALAAAVAVKEYLEREKLPGSVVFYGCSREEVQRLYQAGVFEETDLLLTADFSGERGDFSAVLDCALALALRGADYLV